MVALTVEMQISGTVGMATTENLDAVDRDSDNAGCEL